MNDQASKNIKQTMALDDRPREKAMHKGFDTLSVAELLAVIIGSGTPGENVVALCQRLLHDHNNKLYLVARRSYRDLMRNYKGVGEVKAVQLLATLELARRYQGEQFEDRPKITDSTTAELVKYMENAWLATKVSFCGQFYEMAEHLCVSYEELRELFILDPRVNPSHTFIDRQKPYWDTHCLNKDVRTIAEMMDAQLLKSVIAFNDRMKTTCPANSGSF